MPHIIQIQYDEVSRSSLVFRHEASSTESLINRLQSIMGDLQGGGWIGRGADAYYAEMEQEVLPALRRLAETLDYAGDILDEISNILSGAEEHAASIIGNI